MNILITGSNGFIGKNLKVRLEKIKKFNIIDFNRENSEDDLFKAVLEAETIIHLAGENRPLDEKDFSIVNCGLTQSICDMIRVARKKTPFFV